MKDRVRGDKENGDREEGERRQRAAKGEKESCKPCLKQVTVLEKKFSLKIINENV